MKIKKTVVTTNAAKKQAAASKLSASAPVVNSKQESASTSAGKPKAAKPAQPASAEREPKSGINLGVKTGMRVMAFQDFTLKRNDDPKFRLTDTELAKLWREEFPNSRAVLAGRIDESIVRGVRNLYNQGTGGHGTPGQTHDSKPYIIENGKRVASVYTRTRKVKEGEDDEVETSAKSSKPAPAPVTKKAAKKGAAKKAA